jgi:hypothetical protein
MSCVIVLGCYRSGTSAVAGVLHRLGVMMGKEFDAPADANPTGFWEDLEFKRLFDKMADGKDVDGLLNVLVRTREIEYPLWGLKDPQLCLYLPRLLPMLKESKLISTLRPKEEICRSLNKAVKGATATHNFMTVVDHYLAKKAEAMSQYKGPVLEVDWTAMKADPETWVSKIAEFVGLPFKQDAVDFLIKE